MTALIKFGVRFLEALFVAGGVGSTLVLLLTGVEDLRVASRRNPGATH